MNLNALAAGSLCAGRVFIGNLVFVIVTMLCSSFSTAPAYLAPGSAPLAIGRIKIEGKMIFEYDKLVLKFKGKNKEYKVEPDESGFFSVSLPLGESHVSLIQYSNHGFTFYKNLPKKFLAINLSKPKTIYYIGDIFVEWSPTRQQMVMNKDGIDRVFIGGIAGGFIGMLGEGAYYAAREIGQVNKAPDFLVTNSSNTLAFFKDRFPGKTIVTELLTVNYNKAHR